MNVRKYKTEYLDENGIARKAVFIGISPQDIENDLYERGYTPIKIQREFSFSFKRDSERIIAFFKNLQNLMESGYSLNFALEILYNSETDSTFKNVLKDISDTINRGFNFSDGLKLHPEWFTLATRMIIESGEKSGKMLSTIHECISYLEQERDMNKSLAKEISGPLIILLFGILALFFNTMVTIPRIMQSEFFKNVMSKNTGVGFYLIEITTKLVPILGICLIIFIVGFIYAYRVYQEKVESFLLKIPLINKIWFTREIFLIYFSCAKLIEVGVPLDVVLDVVNQGCRLKQVKKGLEESLKRVKNGLPFYDSLPVLDDIERAIVKGATTVQKLSEVFYILSRKKMNMYQQSIKRLPGICKTFTYSVLVYLFFIMFFGIMVPYFKSMQTMMNSL